MFNFLGLGSWAISCPLLKKIKCDLVRKQYVFYYDVTGGNSHVQLNILTVESSRAKE